MIQEPRVQELCCNILVGTRFFNLGVCLGQQLNKNRPSIWKAVYGSIRRGKEKEE